MATLQEPFDEHGEIALSRQRDLGDGIGSYEWSFDMDRGTFDLTTAG